MSKYDHVLDMATDNSTSLILRRITPGSRVLEFGPSTGYMTLYMKEQLGCSITAIEIDAQDAQAAEKYCEKMIVANLDEMTWPAALSGASFDHIIFADVLEHLRNSSMVLKAATEFLKENGTVLTSIPNMAHNAVVMDLLQGKFEYRPLGLLDDTHVRFFTREHVLKLLAEAGLSPVSWLGTVAAPDGTEFHQNYAEFPEAIQKYLEQREEGHVYQYVTVSKRTQDAAVEEICSQYVIADAKPSLNFLQLYWEVDGNYQEAHSAKLPIHSGEDWIQYHFHLPTNVNGRLRIDPGNWSAYYELHSITIRTDEDKPQPIATISKTDGFAGLSPGNGISLLSQNESYRFMSINEDPYLFVDVPHCKEGRKRVTIVLRTNESSSDSLLRLQNTELESLRESYEKLIKRDEEQAHLIAASAKVYKAYKLIAKPVKRARSLLKKSKRNTRKLVAHLPGWYSSPQLVPVQNVEALTQIDCWKSTGEDPYFHLNGIFPVGWVRISWLSASASDVLPLRLYWEDDAGVKEKNHVILGNIHPGEPIVQHAVVFINRQARLLRLDTGEVPAEFLLSYVRMFKVTRLFLGYRLLKSFFQMNGTSLASVKLLVQKSIAIYEKQGLKGLWKKVRNKSTSKAASENFVDYQTWVKKHEVTHLQRNAIVKSMARLAHKPLISVLVPVYNVDEIWLRKCLDSVLAQIYPHWELCIVDDASPKAHIRKVLEEYSSLDSRIKVVYRQVNGHISESSNTALQVAKGEFIALLDHDDELSIDALYENAALINLHPEADMIYSDEDKISVDGYRHSPFFKPDWSPDTLLSQMYTCHLSVFRTSLVREISGFRKGLEGSQDHDLTLRLSERTQHIYHIPKILYHWRSIPESTASGVTAKEYTNSAGFRAVSDAIQRRQIDGWVEADPEIANLYSVHYKPVGNPLISIIIPTRNFGDILDQCLQSIFTKTSYTNFEIWIVDNGSDSPQTLEVFSKWMKLEPERFFVERMDIPFNYSRLNNQAIHKIRGELILLLNNDIEVISENWLEEMAGQAIRPEIGAVGSCLLYPDNTIQHAGILLGIGGVAGHSHKYFAADHPGYFSRLRTIANYSAVTAACLMVRKEVYLQVGGLDETLSVAFNDVDFCLKLTQMGYYNVWLPHVKLYHHESKSRGQEDTPEKLARFRKEIERIQQRWGSLLINDPFYNPNLTLEHEDYSLRPLDS